MPASPQPSFVARWQLPAICALVLGALSTAYLSAPDSWGGIVFFAGATAGLITFAAGPLVHRPLNRGPWRWLAAAGALFLGSLLLRLGLLALPGLSGDADLWSFGGYACSAPFLIGLLRRTQTGHDRTLWLDTAAITTGSALIGWVMNVAPQLTRAHPDLGSILVNGMYPVMDAMLLTFTVQLGFRRGTHVPALQAALIGLTALLSGDLAYTFIWVHHPGAVNPYVNVLYLIAYGYLGIMAGHPSMRQLSDVDVHYTPVTSRARLVIILVAMLTPASIPVMLPTHGVLDATVRGVIMSVFGGLVFLRLLGTVQALQGAEATARYRATHDGLTDLPNRSAFLDQLDEHLIRLQQQQPVCVNVLLVGCDHFRRINDTWGHSLGDVFLIQVADRLRSVLGPNDVLSRVGGDHFALRIDTPDRANPLTLSAHVKQAFATALPVSPDRAVLLSVSIGIAQSSLDASDTATSLLRNADQAYNYAKTTARGSVAVHDKPMHAQLMRRHSLVDALEGALERGEIHVVYQPIRRGPAFGDLSGWEALARWQHPHLGIISPVDFIPIAEDTELIIAIGSFVLREATARLTQWQDQLQRPDLHMSVNVSSVQIMRGDVVALVSQVLDQTGLDPTSLWLEITESVVIERTKEALDILNALTALGAKLCMDDFGTGYSSLSYLKDFAISILKIDREFIRNLRTEPRDRELTKAMIGIGVALGLDGVVAEGVETTDQAAILTELGCTFAQGYLYGRPAPGDQALASAMLLLDTPASSPLPQQRQSSRPSRAPSISPKTTPEQVVRDERPAPGPPASGGTQSASPTTENAFFIGR
jgi:diguanylate cyclase (GGDEF)-like protein